MVARTISDTTTEICSLRHGIENAAWEEARGKLMAYLRLRGSCFGGDQEEYDALKDEIENFINRIDEGDIYQQDTDELTRLREENARLRETLQYIADPYNNGTTSKDRLAFLARKALGGGDG